MLLGELLPRHPMVKFDLVNQLLTALDTFDLKGMARLLEAA